MLRGRLEIDRGQQHHPTDDYQGEEDEEDSKKHGHLENRILPITEIEWCAGGRMDAPNRFCLIRQSGRFLLACDDEEVQRLYRRRLPLSTTQASDV
jgi:hypothetical protein